jgi:hypothetical protein
MNFSESPSIATVALSGAGTPNVYFGGGIQDGKTYYLNDVYNDTSYAVTFSNGVTNFSTMLPAYGSAVYVLSDSVIRLTVPSLTLVEAQPGPNPVPREFMLSQNFPNPFNPSTSIQFAIPTKQFVMLKVYDILGRVVATLVNERKEAGRYAVQWNASGSSSGIYFCTIRAGSFVQTNKMLLVR